LIIGLERSAIGTVVERTTRFTMLVHLLREEGYRHRHSVKNGPALAGYGAVTMTNALTATMGSLPAELARSLTWDRGKEMSAHAKFKAATGIPVFFADPHSPWQRHQREHQRPATAVLPERHRPVAVVRRPDQSRRSRAEHQAPQDTRLENTGRSLQRTATISRK